MQRWLACARGQGKGGGEASRRDTGAAACLLGRSSRDQRRCAGPAGPWPGELGRLGPVGPKVFYFFILKKNPEKEK